MFVYINGKFLNESAAKISVFDRGLLYGDGIFETMRAYGGHVFRLDAHLSRLFTGLEILRISHTWTKDSLTDTLYQLLRMNNLMDAYIRLTVTRGAGGRGLDITGCDNPTIFIHTRMFTPYPEEYFIHGVMLCSSVARRNMALPADSRLKSLNFLNNILVKMEAARKGAFDAVMLNHDGFLTEGTVSNIFFVSRERLLTPSKEAGILEGITRETVLEIAAREGIPAVTGLFSLEELYRAEEVFITNSMIEIMPVARVDDRSYAVGNITKRLICGYKEMINEELQSARDCRDH
jgi:branched-chain amino acid aminotransferase